MYPNLSLEDATVSAWYAHFQDEDADTFEEALKAAMKTGGDFFPSPHRIADALEKLSLKSKNKYAPVNSEGREAQLRADWKDGVPGPRPVVRGCILPPGFFLDGTADWP